MKLTIPENAPIATGLPGPLWVGIHGWEQILGGPLRAPSSRWLPTERTRLEWPKADVVTATVVGE